MGVIDDVKQRTDIVEIVSQYASLTKSGRTFKGLCPFHSEKNPSFFVYPEQQTWHCFGACNTGGDVYSFIMKKEGADFGDALRLLADRAGVTISTKTEREAEGKERLYQANQAAAQYFHNLLLNSPAGEKARRYVASRGLLPKTITDFQLGFSLNSWDALKQYLMERDYTESELLTTGLIVETDAGKTHDRFRNLLMFPILDARGRTTGFGARVLDDSLPKYINSPWTAIFDKSSSLYGINLAMAAIRQQNRVVLVEGYMDVITAHQNGLHNVIASMGTSVAEKQVGAIKRLTRNITLALDADAAGEEAMLRCVGYENSLDSEVTVIILPEGKDPDDVIKQDVMSWQHLVEQALPVIDYTFDMVTSKLDLTTARDKSLAANKLIPIIYEIKDDIRRDHYKNKLAKLTGISYHSIEGALSRIKPDRRAKEPKPEVVKRVSQNMVSSCIEENCLALILQYPELKAHCQCLLPEYFEDTQNREIFIAFKQADDLSSLKERLDSALHDYFNYLTGKSLLATQLERKCEQYVLRLREKFLRNLEMKNAEVLAFAAESGGTTAELAKLEEQGIEIPVQLGEVFAQQSQTRSGTR
jgi:DNA primase